MDSTLQFVEHYVRKGGPEPHEYEILDRWFNEQEAQRQSDNLKEEEVRQVRQIFGDVMTVQTMQGFVFQKPHGYAGDYEIIDKIYTQSVSPDTRFSKWDLFFHAQSACRAVRNRKQYFIDVLADITHHPKTEPVRVLNVGSGPGRDMYEFFTRHPETDVKIECVDLDENAIAFASDLCKDYKDRLCFHNRNIFRFRSTIQYDLVWSAGLFDYLSDKLFKHLLRNLYAMVAEGGQLVVGNFTPENPTRPYMEFADWSLIHRDEVTLQQLAFESGIEAEHIRIGAEPEEVNLFLHVQKPIRN